MRLDVNRRPEAIEDLAEIWEYSCTNWNEAQADRYVGTLEDAIENLAEIDGRRLAHPLANTAFYRLKCQRHLIVFEQLDRSIDVIRILHVSMDIGRHLG